MQIEYQTPSTVGQIAAVFQSLTPCRDSSQKNRISFWVDRIGDKPLADLSPDDVDRLLGGAGNRARPNRATALRSDDQPLPDGHAELDSSSPGKSACCRAAGCPRSTTCRNTPKTPARCVF